MEKILPYLQNYKKYIVELILISLSLLSVIISAILYFRSAATPPLELEEHVGEVVISEPKDDRTIIVDISGAVTKPDSYELTTSSRLKDALSKAGGLSELADKDFFYRNYNLARQLGDQEKIYIPSVLEVSSGIFKENYRLIDFTESSTLSNSNDEEKINLNTASEVQLDSLPGIGKTTVEKIIQNRPYTSINELISKEVIKSASFEKIKSLVEL